MVNLCATFHLDIWLIIYYNEAINRGQQRPPGKRPLSNATTWVNQSDRGCSHENTCVHDKSGNG